MCVSALICFTQAGIALSPDILGALRGRYHRACFLRYAMVLLIANLSTPHSEQFLVLWTMGTMRKTPCQRKSLHLVIFGQSTVNKECYSSEPKGPKCPNEPAQQENAPEDCSTILLHVTGKGVSA